MPAKQDDPLIFSFFNEIGIIEQLSRNIFERTLPDGLKVSHFSVLNNLARLGDGKSPSSLANAFQVTKPAMTNTLSRLESRGLVMVKADPKDARAKQVFLTTKGSATRDKCLTALAPLLQEIEGEFSKTDFKKALPLLQDIRAYLDTARDVED
jgi:DNA-binding MarR family transcriptional regulator